MVIIIAKRKTSKLIIFGLPYPFFLIFSESILWNDTHVLLFCLYNKLITFKERKISTFICYLCLYQQDPNFNVLWPLLKIADYNSWKICNSYGAASYKNFTSLTFRIVYLVTQRLTYHHTRSNQMDTIQLKLRIDRGRANAGPLYHKLWRRLSHLGRS